MFEFESRLDEDNVTVAVSFWALAFKFIFVENIALVFILFETESSQYPWALESDFHPPRFFNINIEAPDWASNVAAARRNSWPVYVFAFSSPRSDAIPRGIFINFFYQ